MKILINFDDVMTLAVSDVLDDLDFPICEIELTDNPKDCLNELRRLLDNYSNEFNALLKTQFIARTTQSFANQLAEHGISIIPKDSE